MDIGPSEVVVVLIVVFFLFGAKKLPEVARGTGQALRIFKEETRAAAASSAPADESAAGDPRGLKGPDASEG